MNRDGEPRGVPTFTAAIFAEGSAYRVVIEGFGEAEARSLFEAEEIARRLIEWRVGSSYPDRDPPAPPGDAVGVMRFHLSVVRSDDLAQRRELWRRFEAVRREYGLGRGPRAARPPRQKGSARPRQSARGIARRRAGSGRRPAVREAGPVGPPSLGGGAGRNVAGGLPASLHSGPRLHLRPDRVELPDHVVARGRRRRRRALRPDELGLPRGDGGRRTELPRGAAGPRWRGLRGGLRRSVGTVRALRSPGRGLRR